MSTVMNEYLPDYAIHPGEYLEEILEARSMPKVDFARRCGLTPKTVSQIVNQKVAFSPEVALQFETVLGVSADIWMGLLSSYQLQESREKELRKLEKAQEWGMKFPTRDLRRLGIIGRKDSKGEWVRQLLEFFNVSSPESWQRVQMEHAVAFRKSPTLKASPHAIATWLRLAEIQAERISTRQFDGTVLRKSISSIKQLTVQDVEVFEPRIVRLCADAGVAVVFVPELESTRISGVTKWLSPDKALIGLTLRYKTDDHFWFTLFHEIGHLVLHGKRNVFIDTISDGETVEEKEANEFASNTLVPRKAYSAFVSRGKFYEADILRFANEVGIAPGIVVGMLQHDALIEFRWHNNLKRHFEFRELSPES